MAWLSSAILLLTLVVVSTATVAAAVPSPSAVADGGGIASTAQEMQQARYFTFVTLVRMVQEKIPQNTTFLMPSDRMLSTASVPENQVLDLLLRHSIPAVLTFSDLSRLPNRTILPTHHTGQMITVTKREEHQKLYVNNVELTSPDVCHGGDVFRCHGIDGVIRPTTTARRGRGSACAPYAAPAAAAPPAPASAANQSSETSSPSVGSAPSPSLEPAAESTQKSDTSTAQPRLSCAAVVMTVLMLSIF